MSPITRAGAPVPVALEGDVFTVSVPLSAEPGLDWKLAFSKAALANPVAEPSEVSFGTQAVIFRTEKPYLPLWLAHIERCAEAADVAAERLDVQRQAEEAARAAEEERQRREIAWAAEEWKGL